MEKTRERTTEEKIEQAAHDILSQCHHIRDLSLAEDFDHPGAFKNACLTASAIEVLASALLDGRMH